LGAETDVFCVRLQAQDVASLYWNRIVATGRTGFESGIETAVYVLQPLIEDARRCTADLLALPLTTERQLAQRSDAHIPPFGLRARVLETHTGLHRLDQTSILASFVVSIVTLLPLTLPTRLRKSCYLVKSVVAFETFCARRISGLPCRFRVAGRVISMLLVGAPGEF